MGKATNFKFGQNNNRVHLNKSPWKILEKREHGHIQGLSKFFDCPYYLRNGKSYGFQIWPVHSEGPSEQKSIKNFGEKGVWVYPGTVQLSEERVKLRTSNFACTFIGWNYKLHDSLKRWVFRRCLNSSCVGALRTLSARLLQEAGPVTANARLPSSVQTGLRDEQNAVCHWPECRTRTDWSNGNA